MKHIIKRCLVYGTIVIFLGASISSNLCVALDGFSTKKYLGVLDNKENDFNSIRSLFGDGSKHCKILEEIEDQSQIVTEEYSRIPFGIFTQDNIITLAQSFKPTLPVLTKVDLLFKKSFGLKGATVSIKDDLESTDPLTMIEKRNNQINSYPEWTNFDFDDIEVDPDTTYYIVCSTRATALVEIYAWHFATEDGEDIDNYERGIQHLFLDNYWQHNNWTDFCFKTYGLEEPVNEPPIALFNWTPKNPTMNTTITFDAFDSQDPDGNITLYEWDWNNDGIYDEYHTIPTATYSWSSLGNYPVTLRVTDDYNLTDTVTMIINIIDIIVPDDYPTVQEAVNHSDRGYRILVRNGTYTENIIIDVEMLTIKGENGSNTIIDGSDKDHVIKIADNAYSTRISGITIQNSGSNYAGIYVVSEYNNLQDNIIRDNDIGVKFFNSSGSHVQTNFITNNSWGVILDDNSNGNNIFENTITENTHHGMLIQDVSTGNVIHDNILSNNNWSGILIDDVSKGNVITWNKIHENTVGVNCSGGSDGNLFHHNSFIDNEQNAWDSSFDVWDDRSIKEGNYWDDYTGAPYFIPGGDNKDRYPLESPPLLRSKSLKLFLRTPGPIYSENKDVGMKQKILFSFDKITVPDDYPTIQKAVDNASNYDWIWVKNGIYTEHVVVDKPLKITGENPSKTVVDGEENPPHVFYLISDNIEIANFTIENCPLAFSGIRITGNYSNIHDNILTNCGEGVGLYGRFEIIHDNLISNNKMENNKYGGIFLDRGCVNSRVEKNTITNNIGLGIQLGECSIDIFNNTIKNNVKQGIFMLQQSNQNHIGKNDLSYNDGKGLDMFSSNDNTIEENNVNNNGKDGISLYESNYNNITSNRILDNNKYSISLWYNSNNNYLGENNIIKSNSEWGVHFLDSDYNKIDTNTITNTNNKDCITIRSSNNNIISRNIISTNVKLDSNSGGVRVYHSSLNNQIFYNNFTSGWTAHDECANTWDDGIFCGNYWDDYTGYDNNGDGIGDIPYDIQGGASQDVYPLIQPYMPSKLEIVSITRDKIRVKAVIKNTGSEPIKNVTWNFDFSGLIPFGSDNGMEPSIPLEGTITVSSKPVLGFAIPVISPGEVTITANSQDNVGLGAVATKDLFVVLFLLKIM